MALLLPLLNLPAAATLAPGAVQTSAGAAAAAPAAGRAAEKAKKPAKPAKAKGGTKAATQPADGVTVFDFEEGDVITAGEPTAQQVSAGLITWAGGRGRRQIWGFAGGGGAWPGNEVAKLDEIAGRAIEIVAGLQQREEAFRTGLTRCRAAARLGAEGLAKVRAQGPAVSKRMQNDGDFYNDVANFTKSLAAARSAAKKVDAQANRFKAATSDLKTAVIDKAAHLARGEVTQAEAAVKNKQAEIAAAKAVFEKALEIAGKVVEQKWGDLAKMAIDHAQKKAIDLAGDVLVAGRLTEQLAALQEKLDHAKAEVARLDIAWLDTNIETKQANLAAAAVDLEDARAALQEALAELPGAQKQAINELGEAKGTRAAADMLQLRQQQIGYVEAAKAACREYLAVVDKAKARVDQFIVVYQNIPGFLEKAAKVHPWFSDGKPYGRELYRAALANAVALGDWSQSLGGVKGDAQRGLSDYLEKDGPGGPLADFEAAIQTTREQMGR